MTFVLPPESIIISTGTPPKDTAIFFSLQCSFNSKSMFVFFIDKTYSWFAKIFTFGFAQNSKMTFLVTLGTLLSSCRAPGILSKMPWFSTPEAFTAVLNLPRFLAFTFTSSLSISTFRNSIDSLTRTTHAFCLSLHSFRCSCYFLQLFKVQRMTLLKKPSAQIT